MGSAFLLICSVMCPKNDSSCFRSRDAMGEALMVCRGETPTVERLVVFYLLNRSKLRMGWTFLVV